MGDACHGHAALQIASISMSSRAGPTPVRQLALQRVSKPGLQRTAPSQVPQEPQAPPSDPPAQEIASILSLSRFQGPLPPPDVLARYDEVVPGLAERIVKRDEIVLEMAQSQANHREQMEAMVIKGNLKRQAVGQWLAAGIAVTFLAAALVAILKGEPVAGSLLGSVDLASIVAVFITGKVTQKRDQAAKKQQQNAIVSAARARN